MGAGLIWATADNSPWNLLKFPMDTTPKYRNSPANLLKFPMDTAQKYLGA
jgi:hypothetical protein